MTARTYPAGLEWEREQEWAEIGIPISEGHREQLKNVAERGWHLASVLINRRNFNNTRGGGGNLSDFLFDKYFFFVYN